MRYKCEPQVPLTLHITSVGFSCITHRSMYIRQVMLEVNINILLWTVMNLCKQIKVYTKKKLCLCGFWLEQANVIQRMNDKKPRLNCRSIDQQSMVLYKIVRMYWQALQNLI